MTPEQFARWCGPAAIGSALGVDRREAARRILDVGRGTRKRGSCTISSLGRVLRRPVRRTSPGAASSSPTLARWLREHPKAEAVLRASSHFVHVKNGEVVEGNGWVPRRGRVTHVIYLDAEKLT
jgi:hypothetical protein